ncbi:MAG: acyl-CoA dehydrogenase family protein [Janthinobacterium lividum]
MPYFTEEQLALRDTVRNMVEKEVRPIAAEIDDSDHIPQHLIDLFGDMGLVQIGLPEEYGGPGGDFTSLCIVREEISRVSQTCALITGRNWFSVIQVLMNFGNDEQRRRILPQIADGRALSAGAITETEAGSDPASMRTRAVLEGDHYVLNGQKAWVSWGPIAKYITIFAKTGDVDRRGVDNISCFMVERDTPGLSFGKQERKIGMHGVPSAAMFLDNVRVPIENRIGEEGRGFIAAMRILDLNRPSVGAMGVGLAQGAIDLAVSYSKERRQFGKAIADFQGIQFMLADMQMQTEAARLLVYDCARLIDNGELHGISAKAAMSKAFPTDVAMRVTTDAIQILGAAGCSKEYAAERMFRDAKINQIWEGTNQIQRIVIAREMLRG